MKNIIGTNIARARKACGLTQEALGENCTSHRNRSANGRREFPINKDTGINPQTYIAYEK
ncbi:MAG: hypothetical protein E7452_09745 [Ruminococcaceae bacterium]|nr:hypothetical protein [Oscillospiraceae bacterium]